MDYSAKEAELYKQLEITGTTYQIGFDKAGELLGDLTGKIALDFGAGTGRTAKLLRAWGADKVIAVDKEQAMLQQAQPDEGIEYVQIQESKLPFADNYFDVALSAHVFVELPKLEMMQQIASEVYRVLKPGGQFVVIAATPESIQGKYKSWYYKTQENLKSGDQVTVIVKTDPPLEIQDYYWQDDDYQQALEAAGFEKVDLFRPLATGEGWLDEIRIAPSIILRAIK